MQLSRNWRIRSESLNVILERRHQVKATDKHPAHWTWTPQGYYSNTENALIAYLDNRLSASEAATAKALLEAIATAKAEILAAITELANGGTHV